MIKGISPTGILVGIVVSQAASFIFATMLVIALLFIYGNKVLTAFFEYPAPIGITLLLSLVATAIGGYASMGVAKHNICNAFLAGAASLGLNAWFMHHTNYVYAESFPWAIIGAAVLVVPASLGGGYLYQRQHP